MKKCGIYKITNPITNDIYIGSSIDINGRWDKHKKDLIRNKHHNVKLTEHYNIYGLDVFKFDIIELCNKEQLSHKEESYTKLLGTYNDSIGFKKSEETKKKISNTLKGQYGWWNGKHHSEESKQKISNSKKGVTSPRKGVKLSNETKKRISESKKGQGKIKISFTNEELLEMKRLKFVENLTYNEIALKFNCSVTTIVKRVKDIDKYLH